jgi:electron transfer flavoprotein alpha subunit
MNVGNVIAKVRSKDNVKCITVRTTSFPAAGLEGGSATIETSNVTAEPLGYHFHAHPLGAEWLKEEISKSDRPELGAAKIVIG